MARGRAQTLPNRLGPLLEHLSIDAGPGLAQWARVAERVHHQRRTREHDEVPELTRTSGLVAAFLVDRKVRALLEHHSLDTRRLKKTLRIGTIQAAPAVDLPDDLALDSYMVKAIHLYSEATGIDAALTPAGVTYGILATFQENSKLGVLPRHLGPKVPQRLPDALEALAELARSTGRRPTAPAPPPHDELHRAFFPGSLLDWAGSETAPEPSMPPPLMEPFSPPQASESVPLLFISYSHRDRKWRDRLRQELEPYVTAGRIAVWDGGNLRPGDGLQPAREEARKRAAGVILLVSPDYLSSPLVLEEVYQAPVHRLFPLLVRASLWERHPLLKGIQLFPSSMRPLADGLPQEAEAELAEFARTVVEVVGVQGEQPAFDPSSPDTSERTGLEARVPAHLDDPSLVDELGRRPFAEVIAHRIQEIAETPGRGDRAFMVQVHGPWGSGKTTVLNFMREQLQSGGLGARWVVVDFNAWQNEKVRPPWWALIREVYAQAVVQVSGDGRWQAWRLRARWLLWRLRADWFPAALALVVVVAVGLLVTRLLGLPAAADAVAAGPPGDDSGKLVELWLKVVAALFAVGATVVAASRALLLGSARAAKTYLELSRDPMRPISALFGRLIGGIGRPVVIFIDDLDRCRGDYVVELLEGVQTLFRDAPVTYVVAADRDWICASFEKHHADFSGLGDPGRPLGHLFLEKMFQVSATVPEVSKEARAEYWKRLLEAGVGPAPEEVEKASEQAEEEAWRILGNADSEEELKRVIEEHSGDALLQQGLRAAAAKRITAPEARRRTEHRLQRYAHLLEPNPRAMKRLVNAYGIRQAVAFLERREVDPEVMALWTIVEMRWPVLADRLAERPELVHRFRNGDDPAGGGDPAESLLPLFTDASVRDVLSGKGGEGSLGEAEIRSVVGAL